MYLLNKDEWIQNKENIHQPGFWALSWSFFVVKGNDHSMQIFVTYR